MTRQGPAAPAHSGPGSVGHEQNQPAKDDTLILLSAQKPREACVFVNTPTFMKTADEFTSDGSRGKIKALRLLFIREERLASSHRAPCEKHHDRSAELFCEDHRMAICPHCVLEHCQCSKLNSLAGVVEQERVALSERVRVLRDKENTLTVQIGQLEQEVRDAQAHWATMRDEVNATFDHLNEKLETRRHEMLAFLDDKEAVFIEPKKEEQRVLNKERVKAGAHASSADRLVKEASDGALLGMLDKLKDNEEEDTVAVVTFTPERVDVLERSIGELGLITMKPVRMETQGPKENEAENDDIDNEQPKR
ncbi:hypothetical protein BaRGS_00029233, partial [Batillaria attramentaria]